MGMDWGKPSKIRRSPGFIEPCIPTLAQAPPAGDGWLLEIKHDGYRLVIRRAAKRVRVYTRRGYDWTERFPRIVEAVAGLRSDSIVLDGEAAVCGPDGVADFALLHAKQVNPHAILFAFDLLEIDGADLRAEPLERRKARLARLLAQGRPGIAYTDHLDSEAELMFEHACRLGLEGIVSKRRNSRYRSGRSKDWIKVKNPDSPAMLRLWEA
jgi:bifunctional non-homologous end joining protein LigD